MMKTAEPRQGQRLARFGRASCNRQPCRRGLLQADVRAVFVVVGDVFTPKSPEMSIIQRDYLIEQFAANTADPTFRYSVLPRAPHTRANGFQATRLQKFEHVAAKLGVTVEQDVPVGTWKRQGFAQLLYNPIARRVLRDIEVQDTPATVLDDKEAVK